MEHVDPKGTTVELANPVTCCPYFSFMTKACMPLPPGILTTDVPVLSISLEIDLNQNVPLLKVVSSPGQSTSCDC